MSNHTGKAAPTKASNRIAYGELVGKISAGAPCPKTSELVASALRTWPISTQKSFRSQL